MNLGLQLLGGLMKRGGGSPVLPSIDRAPDWESTKFTTLSRNSAGFTDQFEPNADSIIMYVTGDGNDGTGQIYTLADFALGNWDNPGTVNSFATVSAAVDNLRAGFADFVLVKRGDTIVETTGTANLPAGISATERHVIGAYGDLLDGRPVVDLQLTGSFEDPLVFYPSLDGNIAFTGIHYTSTIRDPDSPNFITWYDYPYIQVIFDYTGTKDVNGILVEDNKFDFVSAPIVLNSDPAYKHNDVVIRRNEFANIWWGFAIGAWCPITSHILEENLFYHVGWYDRYPSAEIDGDPDGSIIGTVTASLTGATETSVTLSKPVDLNVPVPVRCRLVTDSPEVGTEKTITNITQANPAIVTVTGHGYSTDQWKYFDSIGGMTELNGNTYRVTKLTNDTFSLDGVDSTGFTAYTSGGEVSNCKEVDVRVTSFTDSTITFDEFDFSTDNVSSGKDYRIFLAGTVIYNHAIYNSEMFYSIIRNNVCLNPSSMFLKNTGKANETKNFNVVIYGNFGFGGEIGISSSGNAPDSTTIAKFKDYGVYDNTFINVNELLSTYRTPVAYGIETTDHENLDAQQNRIIRPGPDITEPGPFPFRLRNVLKNVTYDNNIGFDIGTTIIDPIDGNQTYSVLGALDTDNPDIFINGGYDLTTFMESIGDPGFYEEFYAQITNRRQGAWNTLDRDLKKYIDLAFTPENGAYFVTAPQDRSFYGEQLGFEGETAFFDFDAYTIIGGTVTLHDASDDSVIASAEAPQYSFTMKPSFDGYTVYAKAVTKFGEVVTPNATLTLLADPYLIFNGTNADITFTQIPLLTGEKLRIKFKTTDNAFYFASGASYSPTLRVSTGGGETTISWFFGAVTVDGVSISSGDDFTQFQGDYHVMEYTSSSNFVKLDSFLSSLSASNFFAGTVEYIEVEKAAGITRWDINDRSITTISPTSDPNTLGDITLNNVVDGDWLPVLSPYLTLNGTNADLTIPVISIDLGDSVRIKYATTDNSFYMMTGSNANPTVRVSTGGGETAISYFFGDVTIDGVSVDSGADAEPYIDGNIHELIFSPNINYVKVSTFFSNLSSNTFMAGSPVEIEIVKGGLRTLWEINNGSTTTIAPTVDEIGIGDITLNNVVSGDWS